MSAMRAINLEFREMEVTVDGHGEFAYATFIERASLTPMHGQAPTSVSRCKVASGRHPAPATSAALSAATGVRAPAPESPLPAGCQRCDFSEA